MIAVDYEELPAVTSTAEAPKPGAPRVWDDCPDNICFVELIGDKAAVDAAFRHGRACDQASLRHQPRHRRHDGAARRRRRLQCGRRPLHHLYADAAPASDPRRTREGAQGAGKQSTHRHRRYRRQLRHEVADLQRNASGAARLEAHRPTGQVDQHAHRSVPERCAGARQCHRSGACARQRRTLPRFAREDHCRHRRLSAARDAGLRTQRRHACRRLSHAGDASSTSPLFSPTPIRCAPIAAMDGPRLPT